MTLVPGALSPEPAPPESLALYGALSAAALAAAALAAARFASYVDTTRARVAGALVWVVIAVALIATRSYSGDGAPLARGVPLMAIPVWGTLAALASAAGEEWLGSSWKHRKMAPVVVVLGLGALQLGDASKQLGSTEKMWWSALRRDAAHPRALEALAEPLRKARKPDGLRSLVDKCLRAHPGHCGCLELKAEAALLAGEGQGAVSLARTAADRCPGDRSRELLSRAIASAAAGETPADRRRDAGAP